MAELGPYGPGGMEYSDKPIITTDEIIISGIENILESVKRGETEMTPEITKMIQRSLDRLRELRGTSQASFDMNMFIFIGILIAIVVIVILLLRR